MTCKDHDVQRSSFRVIKSARIPGASFDSVFYADDATVFSTKPRALNELVKLMEEPSEHSGLKIDRGTCRTLRVQS